MKDTKQPIIYSCKVKSFSIEFSSGLVELKAKNSRNTNDKTIEIKKLIISQKISLIIKSFILRLFYRFYLN